MSLTPLSTQVWLASRPVSDPRNSDPHNSDPHKANGLSLAPFRAQRYRVGPERLAKLLAPPYDVIDDDARQVLVEGDPDNIVTLILPRASENSPAGHGDTSAPYVDAARRLEENVERGLLGADPEPALYVYQMTTPDGRSTRGLLGAVELRDPADGVILPHENVMAGPVADRLQLMSTTSANLEPIFLVYEGGGFAAQLITDVSDAASGWEPIAHARTPDGITHTLWAVTDPETHELVERDLNTRQATIADGHHRYATYLSLQAARRAQFGSGPWDRGLTLLVDAESGGLQVEPIHRVVTDLDLDTALAQLSPYARITAMDSIDMALEALPTSHPETRLPATEQPGAEQAGTGQPETGTGGDPEQGDDSDGFSFALVEGDRVVMVDRVDISSIQAGSDADALPAVVAALDLSKLHTAIIGTVWGIPDNEDRVRYAHDVSQAVTLATNTRGLAVLVRATPVEAVARVATQGLRMPRKSTLFVPKPASGIVIRRFHDN
jgi:uncharacterized protein (DUF1015 family)